MTSKIYNEYIEDIESKHNPLIHNCKIHKNRFSKDDIRTFVKGSVEEMGCYLTEADEETIDAISEEVVRRVYA